MLQKAHLFRIMKCKPEVMEKMMQDSEVVDCSSKNEVLPPSKASRNALTPLASEIPLTPLNSRKALIAWLLQASPQGSTRFENCSTGFPKAKPHERNNLCHFDNKNVF